MVKGRQALITPWAAVVLAEAQIPALKEQRARTTTLAFGHCLRATTALCDVDYIESATYVAMALGARRQARSCSSAGLFFRLSLCFPCLVA